jgi:hypothetical protein
MWLLHRALRNLPEVERERCEEEWTAALDALPHTLARVYHAASFIAAARTIQAEALDEKFRSVVSGMVSGRSQVVEGFANLKVKLNNSPARHPRICRFFGEDGEKQNAVLNEAWLHAKQHFDISTSDFERLTASLDEIVRDLERQLEFRQSPLRFLHSKVIERRTPKRLSAIIDALKRLDNDLGSGHGVTAYLDLIDRLLDEAEARANKHHTD